MKRLFCQDRLGTNIKETLNKTGGVFRSCILDDPLKALDPATAAKCWDHGIKGTMSGKTRVLVVNSQMLERFAR